MNIKVFYCLIVQAALNFSWKSEGEKKNIFEEMCISKLI